MAIIDRNNIQLTHPSERTLSERKKFAAQLDDFATFKWDGYDMFNEFGMFIINEKKGSLKMYNGASYKNEYTKQQFQNGYTNLSGIEFETQQISFAVGVYWISIEDYRVMMNLLHPYTVSFLSFDFEKTYGYECKLTAIKDSTRYVVGKEASNTVGASGALNYSRITDAEIKDGYRYYTELNLTFEVMGRQCAKEISPQIKTLTTTYDSTRQRFYFSEPLKLVSHDSATEDAESLKFISDLEYPITVSVNNIKFKNLEKTKIICKANMVYREDATNPLSTEYFNQSKILFSIEFKNLTQEDVLSISYNSEHGLIYWSLGDKQQILSLLSVSSTGERFVKNLQVNQFFWPGRLILPSLEEEINNYTINLDFSESDGFDYIEENDETPGAEPIRINDTNILYSARRRTNII